MLTTIVKEFDTFLLSPQHLALSHYLLQEVDKQFYQFQL